jgi:pyridoxine kinase
VVTAQAPSSETATTSRDPAGTASCSTLVTSTWRGPRARTASAAASTSSTEEVLDAVDALRATGPRDVLVTSVVHPGSPDTIDVVAVSDEGAWSVTTPLLPITPNGGGDLTAALYLAHLRETGSAATALERTTGTVFSVLEATLAAGTRELQIIPSQDAIADPPARFGATRLR